MTLQWRWGEPGTIANIKGLNTHEETCYSVKKGFFLRACFLSLSVKLKFSPSLLSSLISTCSLSFIFSLPLLFLSLSLIPATPTVAAATSLSSSPSPFDITCALSIPCTPSPSLCLSLPPLHPFPFFFFLPGEKAEWLGASLCADSWEPLAVIGSCRLSLPVWSVSSSLSKYADVEMKT